MRKYALAFTLALVFSLITLCGCGNNEGGSVTMTAPKAVSKNVPKATQKTGKDTAKAVSKTATPKSVVSKAAPKFVSKNVSPGTYKTTWRHYTKNDSDGYFWYHGAVVKGVVETVSWSEDRTYIQFQDGDTAILGTTMNIAPGRLVRIDGDIDRKQLIFEDAKKLDVKIWPK